MRGSLVGQNVGDDAALGQFRNHVRAISHQPDGNIFFLAHGIFQNAQRFVERRDHEVEIAGLQPLLDALGIDINSQKRRAGHGRGHGLRSAHSAHSAADNQLAGEIAAEMFLARRGERLERSLHNAL